MTLPPFEELRRLAEQNPAELENLRQRLVEDTISKAPEEYQRRLRGLQFRIDAERQRSSNPMSSCLRLSRMMHDQLHHLLESIQDTPQMQKPERPRAANVIPFPLLANS